MDGSPRALRLGGDPLVRVLTETEQRLTVAPVC
jgi:hypothetical protein